MYVDWEYYKIFYFVAKYRNFTKAARVLGSNQPNITHTMNKLEDQLHCVLFIRSNRGVTLTPEGEMLYTRISSAAVQIQDGAEHLPVGTAAGLPCAVPRYPAADLQPFNAAGDSGSEKRRGRFRCCDDPHRRRGGAGKS